MPTFHGQTLHSPSHLWGWIPALLSWIPGSHLSHHFSRGKEHQRILLTQIQPPDSCRHLNYDPQLQCCFQASIFELLLLKAPSQPLQRSSTKAALPHPCSEEVLLSTREVFSLGTGWDCWAREMGFVPCLSSLRMLYILCDSLEAKWLPSSIPATPGNIHVLSWNLWTSTSKKSPLQGLEPL